MKMRLLAEDIERQGRSDMVTSPSNQRSVPCCYTAVCGCSTLRNFTFQVDELGAATLEMVKTSHLIKHHIQALEHLSSTYQQSEEVISGPLCLITRLEA